MFCDTQRRAGHLTITPTPLSQAKVLLNAEKELALVVWLLLGWEYLWDGPPPPIAACRKARRSGHILLHNFHCFRATSQHSQNPHHGPSAPTSQIINPKHQKEKKQALKTGGLFRFTVRDLRSRGLGSGCFSFMFANTITCVIFC